MAPKRYMLTDGEIWGPKVNRTGWTKMKFYPGSWPQSDNPVMDRIKERKNPQNKVVLQAKGKYTDDIVIKGKDGHFYQRKIGYPLDNDTLYYMNGHLVDKNHLNFNFDQLMKTSLPWTPVEKNGGSIIKAQRGTIVPTIPNSSIKSQSETIVPTIPNPDSKSQRRPGVPTILNPNIRQQTKPHLIIKRHINSDDSYGYNIRYSKPNENNKYLHDIYETDIEEIKPYISINSSGFRIVPHTIGSRRNHYTKEINPKNQYVKITEDSGDVAYGDGFGTFYEQPTFTSEDEIPWIDEYTKKSPLDEKSYKGGPSNIGFENYKYFNAYKKNFNDR